MGTHENLRVVGASTIERASELGETTETPKPRHRGGAKKKTHDGLLRGLYVRVNSDYLMKLEELRVERSVGRKSRLSIADVVRLLIDEAHKPK